jgi:hypothetical protein
MLTRIQRVWCQAADRNGFNFQIGHEISLRKIRANPPFSQTLNFAELQERLGRGLVARTHVNFCPTPSYGVGGVLPLRLLHDLCAAISGLDGSPG